MLARNKQLLAEEAYELAVCYELDYGCCPQCVLSAIQETTGVVDDATIKASHGLSGGGGLMGHGTCGALAGGLLALSAKTGRTRDQFATGKGINNFNKGRMLVEKFRDQFGGVTCADLQKQFTGQTHDMWDQKEYSRFAKNRGFQCANAAGMVARWVVEML